MDILFIIFLFFVGSISVSLSWIHWELRAIRKSMGINYRGEKEPIKDSATPNEKSSRKVTLGTLIDPIWKGSKRQ